MTMAPHPIRRALTHHRLVHGRLKYRLVLYPLVAVVTFGVVIYDTIHSNVSPVWIIAGGLVGYGVGWLVGQAFKISWREDSQKVVMGIDRLSILIIILYVLARALSERLASQYIHGMELAIITYSVLGGILLGRMSAILYKIGRVIEGHEDSARATQISKY